MLLLVCLSPGPSRRARGLFVLSVLKKLTENHEFGPVSQWVSRLGGGAGTSFPRVLLPSAAWEHTLDHSVLKGLWQRRPASTCLVHSCSLPKVPGPEGASFLRLPILASPASTFTQHPHWSSRSTWTTPTHQVLGSLFLCMQLASILVPELESLF